MGEAYRGGNSRILARQLDLLRWPIAVLDQRQTIVYVSGALCELLQIDATRLVGLSCSPQLSADDSAQPQLAMSLAPPAEVLHGRAALRYVPWPPPQPTGLAAQAFVPLIDEDPSAGLILVLFGEPDVLRDRLLPLGPAVAPRGAAADEVLLKLRAQWQHLDGLWPLVGVSSAITLAMRRAQLALRSAIGVMICGPAGSAKSELARAIAGQRTRALELPPASLTLLPIECSLVDVSAAQGMVETLASRLRPGLPAEATHVLLDRLDCLCAPAAEIFDQWLSEHSDKLCIVATSQRPMSLLAAGTSALARLAQQIATVEIEIPPLAQRREDIAAQVQHHLASAAVRTGRRLPGIAPATLELLEAYPWPGNATEAQQAAREMLANAVLTATIQPGHLPLQLRTFAGSLGKRATSIEPISLDEVLVDIERIMLERAIKLSPRNRARAARMLGISRPRFLRRIAQLGLDDKPRSDQRDEEE